MIKVAHEVPISLLEQSRKFNNYDYALVHLFKQYPEYLDFFKKSLEMGREVILDNSIFELGEAFNHDEFAHWVLELKPTYYILPDSLENMEKTITNAVNFRKKYKKLPGQAMGVVQGKTMEEVLICYEIMDKELKLDFIGISFDYKFFESYFPGNKYRGWMLGRKHLLEVLESTVLNKNKKHHLLGASLPQEGELVAKYPWIYSTDTSNPIVHGIKGVQYMEHGLDSKESIKLADLIDHKVTPKQLQTILYNVGKFKQFWGHE